MFKEITVAASKKGITGMECEGSFCGNETVHPDRNKGYAGACNHQNASYCIPKICITHGTYIISNLKN